MLKIPKRKGVGTVGRKIEVETNMLPMVFGKNFPTMAIHYDVEIDPNTPKYMMRKVFLIFKSMKFPNRNPAFDGRKNAFSAGILFKEAEVTIQLHLMFWRIRKLLYYYINFFFFFLVKW